MCRDEIGLWAQDMDTILGSVVNTRDGQGKRGGGTWIFVLTPPHINSVSTLIMKLD